MTPRWLVGLVAALIAARPLVTDGGPGTTGGFVLALGWFVALSAWATWNAWRAPGRAFGGWVALLLAIVVGIVAVRAGSMEPLTWAGLRATWDSATVLTVFIAARQAAADSDDAAGLFAALAASAVAALTDSALPQLAAVCGATWPTAPPDPTGRDLTWLLLATGAAIAVVVGRRRPTVFVPLAVIAIVVAVRQGDIVPPAVSSEPAWAMLSDNPGGGVGPGLYSRFAARYTPPPVPVVATVPPGTYAGLAATCGWPVAVVFALAIVVALSARAWAPTPVSRAGPRWEVYFGGVAGLLGGFVLQVGDLPAGHGLPIRELGVAAAVRGLVWFVSFAVFEAGLAAHPRLLAARLALISVAGLALVYDTLGSPPTAQSFWTLAALLLSLARPLPESAWMRSVPGRVLPMLAALGLLAGYVLQIFRPGYESASALRMARARLGQYEDKLKAIDATPPALRPPARTDAVKYIRRAVMPDLARAAQTNPLDPEPRLDLSAWWLRLWEQGADGEPAAKAVLAAQSAQERDAEGIAGLLAEIAARSRFAEMSADKRDEQFAHLDRLIREVAKCDPARETRLRYELARTHFAAKDEKGGKLAAARAKQLDEDAPGPRYKLTEAEREQVATWLKARL
ncbi:MAG: hypothetical protein U0746_09350 [Gemmataceae bacterium]